MRRWLQFRLSTLLLLLGVCGVAFGWWRDRNELKRQVDALMKESDAQRARLAEVDDEFNAVVGSTAMMNLRTLRSQIQLYQAQHNGKVPDAALVNLLKKTDVDGQPGDDFGPYIQFLPKNPFTLSSKVIVTTGTPSTATNASDRGWLYDPTTGNIWLVEPRYLNK